MFLRLGYIASRWWAPTLLAWISVAALVVQLAPHWSEVARDGEFVFLPDDSPSRVAGKLYDRAFPGRREEEVAEDSGVQGVQQDPLGSNIVLLVRRKDGLTSEDKEFVAGELQEVLEEIARTTSTGYGGESESVEDSETAVTPRELPPSQRVIKAIWTWKDSKQGPLLTSEDGRATLVLIELRTEFLDRGNQLLLQRIEQAVDELTDMTGLTADERKQRRFLLGLDIKISGSATVGRDMLQAESVSAANTEWFTKALVIVLLLLIYRAPLLALIPLATVGLAVEVTLRLLRMMAEAGWIGLLFNGIEVYVTVVVYGAGVDYCLFLIARYKEELDRGASLEEAIGEAVQRVGVALATSAGTSICGIGMMGFAEFGKFRQAGFAISFGLFVVLCAAVTFTPALLRLFGRWAFWPEVRHEQIEAESGLRPRMSLLTFVQEQRWLEQAWQKVSEVVGARPGTVFLVSVGLMLPFAIVAVLNQGHLSYGLLSDLPQDDASVIGANAIQEHFPAGAGGPVTILLHHPDLRLPETPRQAAQVGEGIAQVLSAELESRAEQLKLADIRTQKNPLGTSQVAQEYLQSQLRGNFRRASLRGTIVRTQALRTYLGRSDALQGDVLRLDVVFDVDPFSRDSIEYLNAVEEVIREALPRAFAGLDEQLDEDDPADPDDRTGPDQQSAESGERGAGDGPESDNGGRAHGQTREHRQAAGDQQPTADPVVAEDGSADGAVSARIAELAAETGIYSIGPTPSIRDLKNVTDRDQIRIDILVVMAVYVVLVLLLRLPAISAYLILSVVFSYLVTLGVTYVVFWALDPAGFPGLDWKVPIFLFTILIAMGEDYNILLMTRVSEEQLVHGPVQGVLVALTRTGSIISSCGIIMAGTFSTLMTGTLLGMIELGFALAFGVLLDTFVVRPILVPAYLVMLHSGRFGRLSRWLGAREDAPPL